MGELGRFRHFVGKEAAYEVLTIGISQEPHQSLKLAEAEVDATLVQAMDIGDGIKQPFFLVITDLQELEQNNQIDLLTGLRRMRYLTGGRI